MKYCTSTTCRVQQIGSTLCIVVSLSPYFEYFELELNYWLCERCEVRGEETRRGLTSPHLTKNSPGGSSQSQRA